MYEDIQDIIAHLDEMLAVVENLNDDDCMHLALEFGHQFREELRANTEDA